jgi:glycogen debranching enzyme
MFKGAWSAEAVWIASCFIFLGVFTPASAVGTRSDGQPDDAPTVPAAKDANDAKAANPAPAQKVPVKMPVQRRQASSTARTTRGEYAHNAAGVGPKPQIRSARVPVVKSGLPEAELKMEPTAAGVENEKGVKFSQTLSIKAAIPDHPRAVLKNQNQFMVMDECGLMPVASPYGYGLYRDDTRYLSEWNMSLNGLELTPLYESTADGYAGHFVYANRAYAPNPTRQVPQQKLLVQRDVVINDHVYERVTIQNYDVSPLEGELTVKYAADFADMFEVRGIPRKHRGELLVPKIDDPKRQVVLSYKGLDGQVMKTKISFMRQTPSSINGSEASFQFSLAPKAIYAFEIIISTNLNETEFDPLPDELLSEAQKKYSFERNKFIADDDYFNWRSQGTSISTDNDVFNRLLERGYRDLYILRQQTPKGECLSAGIPWFAVAFGRDQDIAGRETVAIMPTLAKNILEILASYQGTKYDEETEESPGKIMHELRLGEMSRCFEIPFRPFYGSVDSTPLWIILLGDYVDWTGDMEFLHKHWNNVLSALDYLDRDLKNGYLVYGLRRNSIMFNQGWKDSLDSIMDEHGQTAGLPIALCEVQGYLYSAWRSSAKMAEYIGDKQMAQKLNGRADDLKSRFAKDYYDANMRYVALALDGNLHQCRVVASNPGQLLATGILDPATDNAVADKLLSQNLFCGWGIRTLAEDELAYNPISYHNGSVWPHDNALTVEGLCKIGRATDGMRVMSALFEAAQGHLNLRLPELFCGFSKQFSKSTPIWYPVSCEPQAWSAGAMFLMLKSSLGLVSDAVNHQLTIRKPYLPPFLSTVRIANIRVGSETATLYFARSVGKTACTIDKKSEGLKVVVDQ